MARRLLRARSAEVSPSGIPDQLRQLAQLVATLPAGPIEEACQLILSTWRRGGTVFVFGNGGSAATASHIVCDFSKNTTVGGAPRLRCVGLNDNAPLLTALANDLAYDRVFAEQLETLGQRGDLVLAISVSGTSPNVVAAIESARRMGLSVIAMTGAGTGGIRARVDVLIEVPSRDFGWVETAHLGVEHILVSGVRKAMAAGALRPEE